MPTITPNCEVTRAEIDARQRALDKSASSLNGHLKRGGTMKWETHTFSTGKTQTFLSLYDKDGKRVKPLGKKGAGNLWIQLPLTRVSMNRLDPKGAGHFVKLEKKGSGRYRYAIGFQQTTDDFFDVGLFEDYKTCFEALTEAYNVGLPAHFAKGTNTEGTPITSCIPQVKEQWEAFKTAWLDSAKKIAGRAAVEVAKTKLKEEDPEGKLSKEDMAKIVKAAAKKVDFDESTARDDFQDDLITKMDSKNDKFMRAKNFSIMNAEVAPPFPGRSPRTPSGEVPQSPRERCPVSIPWVRCPVSIPSGGGCFDCPFGIVRPWS